VADGPREDAVDDAVGVPRRSLTRSKVGEEHPAGGG
jgi:hypothetical protein